MGTREKEEGRGIRGDEMMSGEDRGVQEMLLVSDAILPWSRLLTHPLVTKRLTGSSKIERLCPKLNSGYL